MIIITAVTIRYHESSFSSLKRVCLALKEELHLASHNCCIWQRQSLHGDGSQLNLPAADPLVLVRRSRPPAAAAQQPSRFGEGAERSRRCTFLFLFGSPATSHGQPPATANAGDLRSATTSEYQRGSSAGSRAGLSLCHSLYTAADVDG